MRNPGRSAPTPQVLIRIAAAAAVVVTVLLALLAARAHGVYWSRVEARFLVPPSSTNPNGFLVNSAAAVDTAAVIGKMVDPSIEARVDSEDVTLADSGIQHGFAVRLPNSGGQFVDIYKTPALDVQAVGTTADEVSREMSRLTRAISADLTTLQDDFHVPAHVRLTVNVTPSATPIYYQKGSSLRAAAATLMLGLALTYLTTRALTRRFKTSPERPPSVGVPGPQGGPRSTASGQRLGTR